MAYCTVDEFKNSIYFIGLEDYFTTSAQISGFLDGVSSIIDNYCGRTFLTGAYQDTFMGNNSVAWFTNNMPLISIESITWQYVGGSSSLFFNGILGTSPSGIMDPSSYWFTPQGCTKTRIRFNTNYIWKINYTAGYQVAQLPGAIKEATMMLAKIMADSADAGNLAVPEGSALNRFKFDKFEEEYVAGSTATNYEPSSLPPTIAGILKKFKYSRGA